ncbi:hypothetical protein [Nocardiopsis potens]|uniref:hypothetical protein n=1 Tax=Nocardiopsis potens TaxID=1246458 RepID=UPI0003465CB8|nr:hypothetical protein [Nocardiopsis potens]
MTVPPLWKRLQLPYVAAVAVLLPVSVAVPWWLEERKLAESGAVPADPVPAQGGRADLAGSSWEVRGFLQDEFGEAEPPPPGISLVDVLFRAVPSDEAAAEKLLSCDFRAEDGRGRVWRPDGSFSTRAAVTEAGAVTPGLGGCADPEGEPLPPGEKAGVIVSFLVPEDAVDSLVFQVQVDTGSGEDEEHPRAPVAAEFRAEKKN